MYLHTPQLEPRAALAPVATGKQSCSCAVNIAEAANVPRRWSYASVLTSSLQK